MPYRILCCILSAEVRFGVTQEEFTHGVYHPALDYPLFLSGGALSVLLRCLF